MQGCEICKKAPNLCWLIPAFSLLPFLSEDNGIISYFSLDLTVRNIRTTVRSCEYAPHYEMHRCVLMTNLSHTFLLSYMKEIVVWSPCFPSWDVTEAVFNGRFFLCLALKDKVFTLACNRLPVANTEEEFSAACWFAFFIIREKEFFHQFLIDLKWVTVTCSVETNHTGPLIDCELFWSVS